MTVLADLIDACIRLTAGIDLNHTPQRFDCAPDVWAALLAHPDVRPAAQPDYRSGTYGSMNALPGLRVTVNRRLEPGAWQVLGPSDVVLHDSRTPR